MDTAIDLFFETFCIQPVSRNKSSPYFGPCIYPIPNQSFRELFIATFKKIEQQHTTKIILLYFGLSDPEPHGWSSFCEFKWPF